MRVRERCRSLPAEARNPTVTPTRCPTYDAVGPHLALGLPPPVRIRVQASERPFELGLPEPALLHDVILHASGLGLIFLPRDAGSWRCEYTRQHLNANAKADLQPASSIPADIQTINTCMCSVDLATPVAEVGPVAVPARSSWKPGCSYWCSRLSQVLFLRPSAVNP